MNEKNRDKSQSKISKKLQLTLNFNPQEILEIVYLEIELLMLFKDKQKIVDYLDVQKNIYLTRLENDQQDINACLFTLYIEVFKIKSFYIVKNKQSQSDQNKIINQANACIAFCRQFIEKYINLLESDIRGRALLVFYLMIELFQCIEINDYVYVENIQKKFRNNIILFFSNFNLKRIQEQQQNNTNICLLNFYVSQLFGTLGIIQYELKQLKDSLENLDISIKIRQDNLLEKSILDKYLNNQQKVWEYELVIFYLKSKKCSCLLKLQRYAECTSYGQSVKQQITKFISKISEDTAQKTKNYEIISKFQNLSDKISQVLSQSNENTKNMLLGNDIQDILKEMKGKDFSHAKQESSLGTNQYINFNDQIGQTAVDKVQKNLTNKIITLQHIPIDSQLKIMNRVDDTQNVDLSQTIKQTNPMLKDSNIFSLKHFINKNEQIQQQIKKRKEESIKVNQNSRSIINDFQKVLNDSINELDASQVAKGQLDNYNQKNTQSLNKLNFSFKVNFQNSQKYISLNNLQKQDLQIQMNDQIQNDLQMVRLNTKNNSGNNSKKEEIKQTISPSKNIILSQNFIKQFAEKLKTENGIEINQLQRNNHSEQKDYETRQRQKKLKLSPSRPNVTNISYFFKPQEQSQQQQQKNLNFRNNQGKKKFIQKLLDQESQSFFGTKDQINSAKNSQNLPQKQNDIQNQEQIELNQKQDSFSDNQTQENQNLYPIQLESERSQQGGYLFTEPRFSEPNIIVLDTQKRQTYSTLNTQGNQEQYQHFNTLQTQQKTLNTEQDYPLQNALKTESSSNKYRKRYTKIKIDQFKQFEVNKLIDGSQTERSNAQTDFISQQISSPSFQQFNQRPDYFNKAIIQMKTTKAQASQSTLNSPKNSRQNSAHQQLFEKNNQIQLTQQRSRKSSVSLHNQQQSSSPTRNFANVVNRDQLFKQISNYSQPKLRVNYEYNLFQQEENLENQQLYQQEQVQQVHNARSGQIQARQIHYNRANKLRKSSLSPNQSNFINQVSDQPPSFNLSKQPSYVNGIGSNQEIQLSKQTSNETSNQNNLVPRINFEQLNQESTQYIDLVQNEKLNNRILSPNTTNFTQGSSHFSSQQQFGLQSQNTHSPSFAKKFIQVSQNLFSQIPLHSSRDKSNLSEKFYILEEQDKLINRKRYSRSTNISRKNQQSSRMRNRFLSSHRKSQTSQEKLTSGQSTPKNPSSFAEKLQASFNSQNYAQNTKSTNLLNSTLNFKVRADQFDTKNQAYIEFNDQNMLIQRSEAKNEMQNFQQKPTNLTKEFRSLSSNQRVRPKTASATKIPQRSISQHSNNGEQHNSLSYLLNSNHNNNILNYFKNTNQKSEEQIPKSNKETTINNQIQIRTKQTGKLLQRPKSSIVQKFNRQDNLQNTASCNNLQLQIQNYASSSQNNKHNKNSYPLNEQSEKGVTTISTKSKSDYFLENLLSINSVKQNQPSALQMVLNEIEFLKKLNEVIENERKQDSQKNKISIKSIIGKFKEDETLLKCVENASMLLDQQDSKRFSQDGSFFALKSFKKIKDPSSFNLLSSQNQMNKQSQIFQRQLSIDKQIDESQNQNEEVSLNSNQEQEDENCSLSKKSQINKLKSEIQRANEQILLNYFPEQESKGENYGQKINQTDVSNAKKSRFSKPSKKNEDQYSKRSSIIQNSAFYSQSGSPKNTQFKSNQINFNQLFQVKDELDEKQLNCFDNPDMNQNSNNNVIFTIQQDTPTEQQDSDLIKMEDYVISNFPFLQKNKFSKQQATKIQQPKEISINTTFKDQPRNSIDFNGDQILSEGQIQVQKKWNQQQHQLQIKKNSQYANDQQASSSKNNLILNDLNGYVKQLSEPNNLYQQQSINSPLFDLQNSNISSSATPNYISRRINIQLKVPKNLDLKRTKLSIPSFSSLEVSSALSKQNGLFKQPQLQTSGKQPLKQLSKEQIKSISYFNQSLKFKTQANIMSNLSIYDNIDEGEEKKKVVTLFKLLEETNKSYEVRDKLINSISGLIKGVNIFNYSLSYPPIVYFMLIDGVSERIRLSINFQKNNDNDEDLYNNKFNISTRQRNNSESESSKNCHTNDYIIEKDEGSDVEVELVIQYGQYQKIYIPINLTRGMMEHPIAERSLLVTVWPLVFKEMERYLEENHLIDVTNKEMLGLDEEFPVEIKFTTQELKKRVKSLGFCENEGNSLNESQILASQNKLDQEMNKSPYLKQKLQTLQNIQLDHIEEISKSSNSDVKQSIDTFQKSLTMNQISNQKSIDDEFISPYPETSDSSVNRKLKILRSQFQNLSLNFELFGGLAQYFTTFKNADAQIIVQKRKKKILSFIDLHEIQGLKDKITSFLRFSFIYVQKEIGRSFCQDFNSESYYRYFLKHLTYLRKQYLRFKAGLTEFPDEECMQPLFISNFPFDYPSSAYRSQNQKIQLNANLLIRNNEFKSMKSSLINNQENNEKQSALERKSPQSIFNLNLQTEELQGQDQNLEKTFQQITNQSFKNISVANSKIRKTIFTQQNLQKQIQFSYFSHIKETQSLIQNALNIYTKSSPSLILSFLKKNQVIFNLILIIFKFKTQLKDSHYLIIVKLVIKQEVIFSNLFNENGEFDIKDNYYFYVSARQLNQNLQQRNLLPPIEISQEQLKPYYSQGDYKLFSSQINKFIIFGEMNKKQKLQLLYFLNNQIGFTPFDKSDLSKIYKQKIIFKDTIALGQKILVADWDSNLAYNLELYRIIFRQIKQKSLFDGTAVSEELSKGYYNLFMNNFNEVYQEHGKNKRVALSVYHNYESDTEEDKLHDLTSKKKTQKLNSDGLPILNNDAQQDINEEQIQTKDEFQLQNFRVYIMNINTFFKNVDQFLQDNDFQQMQKYYPFKVQRFLQKRREWYLTIGKVNRMRINFHYDWNVNSKVEQFQIYFYDLERQKKFCIKQLPLKIQNIIIRLIKWDQERYAYLDLQASKNFQIKQIQNVFFFEAQGFTGTKPIIKINKELSIKTIIISSQKSIKEHLISNSSDLLNYYHSKDYQFCMNMNFYGKCISTLKFYIMKRPQLNYEQMYVFLLIIQPISSKTKQIKFVFSFQDLIMMDTKKELTENLKKRFTRTDITQVIKLISTRIRLVRGLFGAFPILMTDQQSKLYEQFKKENQQSKLIEQLQKQRLSNVIKQRALRQQAQQLSIENHTVSPVNSISAQAQIVRSSRPSLFSKINSLFQKDQFIETKSLNQGQEQSNQKRKSQFFEQQMKQIPCKNQKVLQTIFPSQQESLSSSNSDSSHSSISQEQLTKNSNTQSPNIKKSDQKFNFGQNSSKLKSPLLTSMKIDKSPKVNLSKESMLTFSSKLQDMGLMQNKINFIGENKNSQIKLPSQTIQNYDIKNDSKFSLQKNISSLGISPMMNFLKTKKEVKAEINNSKSLFNSSILNTNKDLDKKQPVPMRSSYNGNSKEVNNKQEKNKLENLFKRTESLDSQKSQDSDKQAKQDVFTRKQSRKVSFVDKPKGQNDSQNQSNQQNQHGILKKTRQNDNDQQAAYTSPRVSFKIQEQSIEESIILDSQKSISQSTLNDKEKDQKGISTDRSQQGLSENNKILDDSQNQERKNDYEGANNIFQDLRVLKNIISRHDFSDGKQSLTNTNKGFLESYLQKSRVIGQYVRKMANSEYVLITVKKDFILKCWDIQIYIPKTQRVLLSQISHSELIDCSYDFLNSNISTKLRFFYENKKTPPFDSYLSFINRVNQYSNRMSTPDVLKLQKNNSEQSQYIPSTQQRQSKNRFLSSIITKLKNTDDSQTSPDSLKQSPLSDFTSPRNMNKRKSILQTNAIENFLLKRQISQKKVTSPRKESEQNIQFSKNIVNNVDLQQEQQLFIQQDQQQTSKSNDTQDSQNIKNINSNLNDSTQKQKQNSQENQQNLLEIPQQRSNQKKVSFIKLISVEDEESKDGEGSKRTNKSGSQKSIHLINPRSNDEYTPTSSNSSKISFQRGYQKNIESPSLISRMLESSRRKGQRRLTFKLDEQQLQLRQSQQNPTSSNSLEDQNQSLINSKKIFSPLNKSIQLSIDKKDLESIDEIPKISPKQIVSERFIQEQNKDKEQENDQKNQEKNLQEANQINDKSISESKDLLAQQNQNDLSKSLIQTNDKARNIFKDLPLTQNPMLSSLKKLGGSTNKLKMNSQISRINQFQLTHSSSLAEEGDNSVRVRSQTGQVNSTQQKQPNQVVQRALQFFKTKAGNKQPQLGNQGQTSFDNTSDKGFFKKNLKQIISQNQQKIIGERNLIALVDFMKPKQFEKVTLQQKMLQITEEMDIAYMTGCPNERIDNLIRFIEIKIWSNFLSQCEFRTDDKHFKVVLFFGSNKLSIQEQLFHDYIKVDQQNESVIEVGVDLQESILFLNKDVKLSTRVQLLQYFFHSFRSIPYTMTSNFSFTVQNVIINKRSIKKFNVNVRELLNLFIAEGFYRFQTNYMSSKVSYSELKNLAYFLIHKIKNSNFLELMQNQEKNLSIDKTKNKMNSLQSSNNNSQSSQQKISNMNSNNIAQDAQLPNFQNLSIQQQARLQKKKKQKKNFIVLKDDNVMYFFEKVINVQLKLIMKVSYFTRSHQFQIVVYKFGTTMSILRNKSLKYFNKKIPFIQQYMKQLDLFDIALSRVCDYMVDKMILYFVIQHNLHQDERYIKKLNNKEKQRKKFSIFFVNNVHQQIQEETSSEEMSEIEQDIDELEAEDNDSHQGDQQDDQILEYVPESQYEFNETFTQNQSTNLILGENQQKFFSSKSLTPTKTFQNNQSQKLKAQRSLFVQGSSNSSFISKDNQSPNQSQQLFKKSSSFAQTGQNNSYDEIQNEDISQEYVNEEEEDDENSDEYDNVDDGDDQNYQFNDQSLQNQSYYSQEHYE